MINNNRGPISHRF